MASRSANAAAALTKPFEGRNNRSYRKAESNQTPDRIRHAKESNCQGSGWYAGQKGQHPPKHYESPGAIVASHSRLQIRNYHLAGL
jgi:hypothetical protein